MDLKVNVAYKNKNLETIQTCEYQLKDYTDMLSTGLKRIISDVEDLVYIMNGNRPKDEWNDSEIIVFNKIKHKLFDKAGEVSRIPDEIFDADIQKNAISSFWDRLFNTEDGDS